MNHREPLFLRFINKGVSPVDLLQTFATSSDPVTSQAAKDLIDNPPNLEEFRLELQDAVSDMVKEGIGEEFKAFVNYYMEDSLVEDIEKNPSENGENIRRVARVKDPTAPWVQGLLCYNVCLYIKAFGMDWIKKCKICGKVFAHKGKYAVYCSDPCKVKGKKTTNFKEKVE